MGVYEKRLYDTVSKPGFKRLFYGKCKECGARIWSIDEDIDIETGRIKAKFICNCGAKFRQTVYSRGHQTTYRYQQGIVDDMVIKGKKRRIIRTLDGIYFPTGEKILKKPRKEK